MDISAVVLVVLLLVALAAGAAVGASVGVSWGTSRARGRWAAESAALHTARDGADARRADAQRAYDQLLAQVTREHERDRELTAIVAPLQDTLGKVEAQLAAAERSRSAAQAALREQVDAVRATSESLRGETTALATALRAPQVRGRWGEIQLERIVEAAGMVAHCDFVTQPTTRPTTGSTEGTLRPDLVVRLTGGKQVVVDAKVPFAGFLDALDARDEETHRTRMRAHARHVREHVDRLAAKAYWERFTPSPEFVVMFVPSDGFLAAALEHDPAVLEHAFSRDVVIATPTTLVALLRTVAYAWRHDAVAQHARDVLALGRELHARLATMGDHLGRLGRELTSAVDAYNRTVGSLETRVLVTARRFAETGVVSADAALVAPPGVTEVPRALVAPELVDPAQVPEGPGLHVVERG